MEMGVFGLRGFEIEELRLNLCRIPQVSRKISEAQKILETMKLKEIDLHSLIISNEKFFTLSREFRSFIISLISMGLYETYAAKNPIPQQMLLNENLELLIDYLRADVYSEKKNGKVLESFCRTLVKKSVFAKVPHKELNPVSYGLFTSHARWMMPGANHYGLFFQYLTQAVRESGVTKLIYFGPENEEFLSLQKLVLDRWPNVDVVASVNRDENLRAVLFASRAV